MNKIDCFGDMCPVPLLKLKKQLKEQPDGIPVTIVVDHSCVVESIEDYYNSDRYDLVVDEVINGVWEITVTKVSKTH